MSPQNLSPPNQNPEDIKEMTNRLNINYDILSDCNLNLANSLKLPTFSIGKRVFIKRLTLIVNNISIEKVFYPVFPVDKHINEVIKWLKNKQNDSN